jgi:type IV pilus assembly protein PilE
VELCVALTVAALLAAVAVPGWRDRVLQARRTDAVEALTRLQAAQEGYRAHHGLYAATVQELGLPSGSGRSDEAGGPGRPGDSSGAAGGALSREGHYRIALQRSAAEAYAASASAQGGQAADTACATLTLQVTQGFAVLGPSARCWNR